MKPNESNDYISRDRILKLLSDEELARVSTAEAASQLRDGEDYIDLKNVERGVQRVAPVGADMGHVLPRKVVSAPTWTRIVASLEQHPESAR